MKQISHTLDEQITQDIIIAANLMDKNAAKYLSGGMSVQTYLPHRYYRPTRDVDFTVNKSLGFPDYKELVSHTVAALERFGYAVEVQKTHQTYTLQVESETDALSMQMRRLSPKKFQELSYIHDREFANAEARIVGKTTNRVIRPEDLIARKLVRTCMFEKEYCLVPRPWSRNLRKHLDAIKTFRQPIIDSIQNTPIKVYTPEIMHVIATIRLQADLFDIGALMKYRGIDEDYFSEVLKDYDVLQKNESKVRKIIHGTGAELFDDAFFTSENQ